MLKLASSRLVHFVITTRRLLRCPLIDVVFSYFQGEFFIIIKSIKQGYNDHKDISPTASPGYSCWYNDRFRMNLAIFWQGENSAFEEALILWSKELMQLFFNSFMESKSFTIQLVLTKYTFKVPPWCFVKVECAAHPRKGMIKINFACCLHAPCLVQLRVVLELHINFKLVHFMITTRSYNWTYNEGLPDVPSLLNALFYTLHHIWLLMAYLREIHYVPHLFISPWLTDLEGWVYSPCLRHLNAALS